MERWSDSSERPMSQQWSQLASLPVCCFPCPMRGVEQGLCPHCDKSVKLGTWSYVGIGMYSQCNTEPCKWTWSNEKNEKDSSRTRVCFTYAV